MHSGQAYTIRKVSILGTVGVGIGNFGINEMVVQRSAVIIPYIGANPRNTLNMVEWGRNVTEYKWNVCHVALR